MKRCPECNRVESDDALAFCRADGRPLISDSGLINAETDVSSEIRTSLLPHRSDSSVPRLTAPTTLLPVTLPESTRELSEPKRRGILIGTSALAI